MGDKDITEKILEDYNDVFADIINGLLFDGVQEIKPEALENTNVHAQYKAEDEKEDAEATEEADAETAEETDTTEEAK